MKKSSVAADSSGLLKIEHYMKEQRVFSIEKYLKNNEVLTVTVRNFRTEYGWYSGFNFIYCKGIN